MSLSLSFGLHNLSESAASQADSFPAYFKLKEVFEEPYIVTVHVLNSAIPLNEQTDDGDVSTATSQVINLSVFPSMTVEDVKQEIMR